MSTAESRLQGLRDWVVTVTQLADDQVVVSPFDGTRPSLPYATLQTVGPSIAPVHDEVHTDLDDDLADGDGAERVRGHRKTTYDLNVYGLTLGVDDLIEAVRHSMQSPSLREQMCAIGLQILDVGNPRDLSELVDTRHERRLQCEITVGYALQWTRTVATIEQVVFTGEVLSTATDAEGVEFVVEAGAAVPPETP